MWVSVFKVRLVCRNRYKAKSQTLVCFVAQVWMEDREFLITVHKEVGGDRRRIAKYRSWVNGTGYINISCILNQYDSKMKTYFEKIQLNKVEMILIKLWSCISVGAGSLHFGLSLGKKFTVGFSVQPVLPHQQCIQTGFVEVWLWKGQERNCCMDFSLITYSVWYHCFKGLCLQWWLNSTQTCPWVKITSSSRWVTDVFVKDLQGQFSFILWQ